MRRVPAAGLLRPDRTARRDPRFGAFEATFSAREPRGWAPAAREAARSAREVRPPPAQKAGPQRRGPARGAGGGFDDSGTASDAEPGASVGPSGVVPTAPKRARTGSAKQLKSAAAAAAAARAGAGSGGGSEGGPPGHRREGEGELGKSATIHTTQPATQPKKRGRPRKTQPDGAGKDAGKEPGAGGKEPGAGGAN